MVRPKTLLSVVRNVLTLILTVRLGNSGLKVSKIILGCMSYGSKDWMNWVLPEEEAIKHIKYASVDAPLYTFAPR